MSFGIETAQGFVDSLGYQRYFADDTGTCGVVDTRTELGF
jgi:hypothetical protein